MKRKLKTTHPTPKRSQVLQMRGRGLFAIAEDTASLLCEQVDNEVGVVPVAAYTLRRKSCLKHRDHHCNSFLQLLFLLVHQIQPTIKIWLGVCL